MNDPDTNDPTRSIESTDALLAGSTHAVGWQHLRLRTLRPDVRKAALWGRAARRSSWQP